MAKENSIKKNISKSVYFSLGIIVGVLILGIAVIFWPKDGGSTSDLAKCIGEKSTLYVQTGCYHCKTQEELFGDDLKYLNIVDCYYEQETCIRKIGSIITPTWVFEDGSKSIGVQSLNKLKELSGC
jgi:hypothetical protein